MPSLEARAYRAQFVELKEAYDKMNGVKNKPDFNNVYEKVNDVVANLRGTKKWIFVIKEKAR